MKKEDYLMRMIEEMALHIGHMVKQAIFLKQAGQQLEAHESISQAVEDLTKLPMDRLLHLDFTIILDHLRKEGVWEERAYYLGVLLNQDADLYEEDEDDTAVYLRKALALKLWLSVDRESEESLISINQIEDLILDLNVFQHHGALYYQIMNFFIDEQLFAKAENILFDWVESEVALEDMDQFNPMEQGIAFYEQIESLDDARLKAGGLPRSELIVGKNELLAYFEEE